MAKKTTFAGKEAAPKSTPKAGDKKTSAKRTNPTKKVEKAADTKPTTKVAKKTSHREQLAKAATSSAKKDVPAIASALSPEKMELLLIDPVSVKFNVELNPRKEYGDLQSLERYIREAGAEKLPPIKVKETKDGFELIHGYRRMSVIAQLISKGLHPGRIRAEVVSKGYTAQEELLEHLTANEGKNLTPFEQAFVYHELTKSGVKAAAIRKLTGKSANHIKWMIRLAAAPKGIHDAIIADKVAITMAVDFINKFGDKAEGKLLKAIAISEEKGEKKVDKKSAEAAGYVKKHAFINAIGRLKTTEKITVNQEKKLDKLASVITLLQEEKDTTKLLKALFALI